MAEKRFFRQAALDRLASPDQLDRLLPVAERRGWFALALLGVLGACLAAWSLGASVPVTLSAPGILTAGAGRIVTLPASANGRLGGFSVAPGEVVRRGQPLADIILETGGPATQAAPLEGRVLELKRARGATVRAGEALLSIESGDPQRLEGLLFLPADQGKQVKPGMAALLTPAGARAAVRGTVSAVSPYPLSAEAIGAMLANQSLAASFGAPAPRYAVRVALAPGASLSSGTLVDAEITLRQRRPIDMVLPGLDARAAR
ncbi:HlyD family efflux transporter periplasmic adaptor subunit [Massilia solisilvae]|uniref:HlyD family efflux transporter periplasmic adaptor subunit n=1 Tax=Massilia solisilvae TaxID=1811225 RepID=A0ABT2BN56_9BURK|nr:HlyD family efflux transporter periplasmic adaptor subunit [Massilia solisilvae]MCS0609954.1 HlyD family efflux transporter periplasmic adaptor subunit [Massilia solisilvae]